MNANEPNNNDNGCGMRFAAEYLSNKISERLMEELEDGH